MLYKMLMNNKEYITYETNETKEIYNYCNNVEYYYKFMMFYNLVLYVGFVGLLFERLGFFNNIDDAVYNFAWNCLKYYSSICLYVKKYINSPLMIVFHNKLKQIKLFLNGHPDTFIIIRDGDEIMRFKYIYQLIEYYFVNRNIKNDNLLYIDDKIMYYTTCFEFLHMIKNKNNLYNYDISMILEFSSIKFMSCELFIITKNKDLFIKKSIDINNFMIVNSKLLSKSFVFWYCNKYFNINKNYIEDYKIDIIDQDVDHLSLDMKDFIEIHKDEYVVHKTKHQVEEINNDDEDAEDDVDNTEVDEETPTNEMDKLMSYDELDKRTNDNNKELTEDDENETNDECKYHKDLEDTNELFNETIEEHNNYSWVSRLLFQSEYDK